MDLTNLLFPGKNAAVALVGGGGKTSIMARTALEASTLQRALLLTTTTKLQRPCPIPDARIHVGTSLPELNSEPVLWVGEAISGGEKWSGPGLDLIENFLLTSGALTGRPPVLIEADGSAGRPIKAPGSHEPVIPAGVDTVAAVLGLSALGRPVGGLTVHRLDQFLQIARGIPDELISPELLLRLIIHPLGSFRSSPRGVRKLVFLNQGDTGDDVHRGENLAEMILKAIGDVEFVVITSFTGDLPIHNTNPIRSIVTR